MSRHHNSAGQDLPCRQLGRLPGRDSVHAAVNQPATALAQLRGYVRQAAAPPEAAVHWGKQAARAAPTLIPASASFCSKSGSLQAPARKRNPPSLQPTMFAPPQSAACCCARDQGKQAHKASPQGTTARAETGKKAAAQESSRT